MKSKSPRNAIAKYLKDNMGHYINPFRVETTLDEDGSFDMSARWPDVFAEPDYNLEISISNTTVAEFSKLSGITTVEQLHFVSPHMLIELFHKGIAGLCCMIDNPDYYYELRFHKKNGKLYMTDEEEDIKRLVKQDLQTPGDFFEFTRNYITKL
jgi:hypothetical protein